MAAPLSDPALNAPSPTRARTATFLRCLCDGARLMVGMPSYETYVVHMRQTHSGQPVMTYAKFFRERQEARYGGGGKSGFRCC